MNTFERVWEIYITLPPRDLITATLVVDGKSIGLNHALRKCFSDTDDIPNELRKQVVIELNSHRPMMRSFEGDGTRREPDTRYWNERIWRYSQAARALCPLLERKMALPGRYTTPPG